MCLRCCGRRAASWEAKKNRAISIRTTIPQATASSPACNCCGPCGYYCQPLSELAKVLTLSPQKILNVNVKNKPSLEAMPPS